MLTFAELEAQQEADRARRIAYIRSRLTDRGGVFTGRHLTYHLGPNSRETRDRYPWRVTVFGMIDGQLTPYSHTEHQFLDLPEDDGPCYRSCTWEILYSVDIPR
jgi:hypothetical protein